jgi:hypothetical protein
MCATHIYACGKAAWNEASSSLQPCAERRSQGRQGAGYKAAPHVFVSNTIYLNLWLPPKIKVFWFFFQKRTASLPAFYARRIVAENDDKLAQRNKRLHFGFVLCWRRKRRVANEKPGSSSFLKKRTKKLLLLCGGGLSN